MRILSRWIWLGGAVLIVGLVGWFVQAHPEHRLAPIPNVKNVTPGLRLGSTYLYVYDDQGHKQCTLTAVDAIVSQDQRFVQASSVKDGRFYRDARIAATFSAGPARFDRLTQDLDLGGPIIVNAANGVHLRCGSMHLDHATRHLTGLGPLTIATPTSTFTAGKLEADLALSELTFEATPGQPVGLTSRLTSGEPL
jgi:LPS export ABC transporter protein LptC